MSIKPLSYQGFSLDFLVAGSNREKEGKGPGDITACVSTTWLVYNIRLVRDACVTDSTKRTFQMRSINEAKANTGTART